MISSDQTAGYLTQKPGKTPAEEEEFKDKEEPFRVFVRLRPLNSRELEWNEKKEKKPTLKTYDNQVFLADADPNSNNTRGMDVNGASFDGVFDGETSNRSVFDQTLSANMDLLSSGYNCSVFTYGMTGSGKTYTMFGDLCNEQNEGYSSEKGLVTLAIEKLFESDMSSDFTTKFTVSYLEVYNEQVIDLLSEKKENLLVVDDPVKGIVIPNLLETQIKEIGDLMGFVRKGNAKRTMATTFANKFSSRSHAILRITITQNVIEGDGEKIVRSSLWLIDLAGSERAAVNENRGLRFQEGANINKSLLSLGKCIAILSDPSKKGAFVPYRDSKLTRLLKDSLGGNSRAIMIACVSQHCTSYEETINTLKYAIRARSITKRLTQNKMEGEVNLKEYKDIIDSLRAEIQELKRQISPNAFWGSGNPHSSSSGHIGTVHSIEKERQALAEVESEVERVSEKLFSNLEEHWELTQTLNDLKTLKETNETRFMEVSNQIQKMREQNAEDLTLKKLEEEQESLRDNLANNEKIQKECETNLGKNLAEKKMLKQQMNMMSQNSTIFQNILKAKREVELKTQELEKQVVFLNSELAEKNTIILSQAKQLKSLPSASPKNSESRRKQAPDFSDTVKNFHSRRSPPPKTVKNVKNPVQGSYGNSGCAVSKYYKNTMINGTAGIGQKDAKAKPKSSQNQSLRSQPNVSGAQSMGTAWNKGSAEQRDNSSNPTFYKNMLSSNLQMHVNITRGPATVREEDSILPIKRIGVQSQNENREKSQRGNKDSEKKNRNIFRGALGTIKPAETIQNLINCSYSTMEIGRKKTIDSLRQFSSQMASAEFISALNTITAQNKIKEKQRNTKEKAKGRPTIGTNQSKNFPNFKGPVNQTYYSGIKAPNSAKQPPKNTVNKSLIEKPKSQHGEIKKIQVLKESSSQKEARIPLPQSPTLKDATPIGFKGDISSIMEVTGAEKENDMSLVADIEFLNEGQRGPHPLKFGTSADLPGTASQCEMDSDYYKRKNRNVGGPIVTNVYKDRNASCHNFESSSTTLHVTNFEEIRAMTKKMKQELAVLSRDFLSDKQEGKEVKIPEDQVAKVRFFVEDYFESGVRLNMTERIMVERLANAINWVPDNCGPSNAGNPSHTQSNYVGNSGRNRSTSNWRNPQSSPQSSIRDFSVEKKKGPRGEVKEIIKKQQEHWKKEQEESKTSAVFSSIYNSIGRMKTEEESKSIMNQPKVSKMVHVYSEKMGVKKI